MVGTAQTQYLIIHDFKRRSEQKQLAVPPKLFAGFLKGGWDSVLAGFQKGSKRNMLHLSFLLGCMEGWMGQRSCRIPQGSKRTLPNQVSSPGALSDRISK